MSQSSSLAHKLLMRMLLLMLASLLSRNIAKIIWIWVQNEVNLPGVVMVCGLCGTKRRILECPAFLRCVTILCLRNPCVFPDLLSIINTAQEWRKVSYVRGKLLRALRLCCSFMNVPRSSSKDSRFWCSTDRKCWVGNPGKLTRFSLGHFVLFCRFFLSIEGTCGIIQSTSYRSCRKDSCLRNIRRKIKNFVRFVDICRNWKP